VPADPPATSFIGSTLEPTTVAHHCPSMPEATSTCLRSRISRRCSR
jgi:hypothetical protein